MPVIPVHAFPPDGLVGQLEAQGLSARLSVEGCEGGPDCRLEVRASGRAVLVELLCPLPGLLAPSTWRAVRVTRRGRTVWAGPPRMCDKDQLCRFLHELAVLPTQQLSGVWQRLG